MGRILWLDGLRGIASAIVVLYHSKVFEPKSLFGFLGNSYWDEPAEENRRFIQLPPIRLLLAGASMVCLFMVISGYAISLSLLRVRDDNLAGNIGFFRRLCSAATRRIFRIYLPSITIISITQFLYFCNVYQWEPPNDEWLWGLKPLTAPWSHIKYMLWNVLHLLDISNHRPDINFVRNRPDLATINYQLWTMPVEFRGSCAVYLLILALAFWRPQPRRLALVGVAIYWFYVGQWDLFAFVAGVFLAERHVASDNPEADGELALPCQSPETWKTISKSWRKLTESAYFNQVGTTASFIVGIYLLCMCHADTVSHEYRFLLAVQSPGWDHPEMLSRCWRSVGAVLTIYAISKSALLQRPLNSRPVQYLGKISFPLYLVHQTVYLIIKRPVRNILWLMATGTSYPDTIEASKHALAFGVAWGGSVLVSIGIMVLVAELWNRFVDMKCMQLARRFEKWITR